MKKIIWLLIPLFCITKSNAQLIKKLNPAGGAFSDALSKIVIDFRNNFYSVQGNALPSLPDAEIFKSTVCLPSAEHCVIYRYHSVEDKNASWQSIMYTGESFDDALKAYKNAFNQVKKTQVKGITDKTVSFDGKMDNPDENLRFSVSSLRLKTDDLTYRDLVAEVEMTNSYEGWEVHLNVYSKKYKPSKEKEEDE